MSIALVQQKAANSQGVTMDASPTIGNSLIFVASISAGSSTGVSGGGVTWAKAKTSGSAPTLIEIWYGHGSDGTGGAVSITGGRGFNATQTEITEWSGLSNTTPDATGGGTGSDTAPATGSIITTHANCLLLAGAQWTANDYSSGPSNSFTRLTQIGVGSNWQEEGYRIVSATGTYSTAWVLTAGINWATAIAAFPAPDSGPTPAQSSAGFFMVN